jgi:RimJ/RimL family protein N-acetyltransferase
MAMPDPITTARLVLRPVRREDGPALLALISNWNVARWLTRVPWPYRPEDMTEFIETVALPRSQGPKPTLAILLDGQPIGAIECTGQAAIEEPQSDGSDLGYWLGEPYWGRGYVTEAVSELVGRIFAIPTTVVIRSAFFEGKRRPVARTGKARLRDRQRDDGVLPPVRPRAAPHLHAPDARRLRGAQAQHLAQAPLDGAHDGAPEAGGDRADQRFDDGFAEPHALAAASMRLGSRRLIVIRWAPGLGARGLVGLLRSVGHRVSPTL